MKFLKTIIVLLTLLFSLGSWAGTTNNVQINAQSLVMGGQSYLAVLFRVPNGWHNYWLNPGDAGAAADIRFTDKSGKRLDLEAMPWPIPWRLGEHGNIAYAYWGEYALYYRLSEPLQLALDGKTISVKAEWVACHNLCVPEEEELDLKVYSGITSSPKGNWWSHRRLQAEFLKLPQRAPIPEGMEFFLSYVRETKKLYLHYHLPLKDKDAILRNNNLIFPLPHPAYHLVKENLYWDAKQKRLHGVFEVNYDGSFVDRNEFSLVMNQTADSPALQLFVTLDIVSELSQKDWEFYLGSLSPLEQEMMEYDASFLWFLLLSILGGFILNFMPCVLPVIGLKLFNLVKLSGESRTQVIKGNLFYSLGVLLSFEILALVVVVLKSMGENIGWGFQLQSSGFVQFMIVILFVMGLSMLGVFEFQTPGGRFWGKVQVRNFAIREMFAGAIATILATPCSAPFLGTALTFAFTTSAMNIFFIFTGMAIGLSFPFWISCFFPRLVNLIPRPGAWMENLKKIFALSLLLTALWLFDLWIDLIEGQGRLYFIFFLLFLWGFLGLRLEGRRTRLWGRSIFLLLLMGCSWLLFSQLERTASGNMAQEVRKAHSELVWQPWKKEAVDATRGLVFIQFTAKWCFTCKVNKALVLGTDEFSSLMREFNVHMFVADWTKRDSRITEWLQSQGKTGVPAYFLRDSHGKFYSLGETVTVDEVRKYLEEIASHVETN